MRSRTLALACVAVSSLSVGSAQAGIQLFEGSWVVKAFGNERTGGTGASELYSAIGIPLGRQCNPHQPRCPFESTPTNGAGIFEPLGGSIYQTPHCAPIYNFHGMGTTRRPRSRSDYYSTGSGYGWPDWRWVPFFRNPAFFTPSGDPNIDPCDPRSTSLGGYGSLGGGPGIVQAGFPITSTDTANTTQMPSSPRGFSFDAAAALTKGGIRGTRSGDLPFNQSSTTTRTRSFAMQKGCSDPASGRAASASRIR